MIRATVTAVWKDGAITVHIQSGGQKITLQNVSDVEDVHKGEPARSKRKGERLL